MNALFSLSTLLAALSPGSVSPGLISNGTPLEQATEAFQSGEYARVLELVAPVAADSADYPRVQYLAGEAQLVLGDALQAESSFRRVLARRPQAVPAQVGLGRALTSLAKLDEADQVLKGVLSAAPKDVGALVAHGLLLSVQGKSIDARRELEAAWKLDPKNAITVRGYVEVLLRADDAPGAAAVIESFVAARPEHPLGPFLMAWTMERDGEDEAAIEQYLEAIERDPGFLDAHKNLAILCHTLSNTYKDKERTRMAYEHYERYFALGGKDAELKGMYETLLSYKEQILGM